MVKTTFLIAFTALAVGGGAAVMAEQHFSTAGAGGQSSSPDTMFVHAMCDDGAGGAAKPHLPADLAKTLELTSAQQADVDRLASEACATMTRIHEEMASVLTPEQLEKLHAMHAGGNHLSALHQWIYKLHGGH